MADPHSPVRSSASSDVRPEEAGGEPEAAPCPAVSVFLPRPPVGVMAVAQGFGDRLALTQGTAAAHRRCEASGYLTPTSPPFLKALPRSPSPQEGSRLAPASMRSWRCRTGSRSVAIWPTFPRLVVWSPREFVSCRPTMLAALGCREREIGAREFLPRAGCPPRHPTREPLEGKHPWVSQRHSRQKLGPTSHFFVTLPPSFTRPPTKRQRDQELYCNPMLPLCKG